jgi:hypothetical protein
MMPMTTANSSHTMHKILLIRALANGRTRGLGFREERRSVNLRESSLKDLQALVGLGEGKMRSQRLLTSCYCIGAVDLTSTSCCSRNDYQAVRGIREQEEWRGWTDY